MFNPLLIKRGFDFVGFLSLQKYPEKLYFEGLAEQVNPPVQIQPQYLPIYFGNVCLRFLPVFDIVIHRFLELLPVSKSLETLLDHLGGLYKFHGKLSENTDRYIPVVIITSSSPLSFIIFMY